MLRRIWNSTKPPVFPEAEQNRIANLLHITITILLLGTFLGGISSLIFGYYPVVFALAAAFIGISSSLIFLKNKYLRSAIWVMLLSFISTLIMIMFIGDGTHDIIILLFPAFIVVAGLLLGRRSLVIFTIIVILGYQAMILGEITGVIVNKFSEHTLISDLVSIIIILSITGVEAFLLSHRISEAFQRSHQNEQNLKENNLKLQKEIKERNRAEISLIESEKKYRALTETTMDTIFALDLKGRFTYLNPAFERATGYKIQDFIGLSFTEIVPSEYVKKTMNSFKKGISGKNTPLYQIELIKKDGKRIPVELNMSTVYDNKGKVVGRIGIARDISDRIEADEKIIFERNRAEFYLDLLSHDIANIQQGIHSTIQIAELKRGDKNYIDNFIKTVKNLSMRSINLLKNAKILSNLGDMEMKLEPMNLNKVIHGSINDIRDIFQEEDIDIKLKSPLKDVYVSAAPLVSNIFLNLLHNGIKYQTSPRKRIDIDILPKKEKGSVEIVISDRGPGIPDHMKELIFQRHRKAGDIRLSGIGLSLVKELVDRYKGSIKIKDRKEGNSIKGAVFIVTLPLAE